MALNKLEYSLNDGYIDNWLVLGPVTSIVTDFSSQDGKNLEKKSDCLLKAYVPSIEFAGEVIDLGEVEVGQEKATWHYRRCLADHRVDVNADYAEWRIARTYVYAEISSPQPARATFGLFTNSLVTVWLNGEVVFQPEGLSADGAWMNFDLNLEKENQLVLRLDQLGSRSCQSYLGLRILEGADPSFLGEVKILLPTSTRYPRRFQALENGLERAHLEEVVNYHGASFKLHWSDEVREELQVAYQVQDKDERIYVEGTIGADPETISDIGHTVRLFERPYRVVLKAPAREYYSLNNRYQRVLPLYVLDTRYALEPVGNYPARRAEALKDASKHDGHLFAQIAKMAQDRWDEIVSATVEQAVDAVARSTAGSDVLLLGLLGCLARYADKPAMQDLREPLHQAVQRFKFDPGMPGGDALDYDIEAHQLTISACKILAGQEWEEFSPLQVGAEALLSDWLKTKGTAGFSDWLSNSETELVAAGLATLASLAKNTNVRELSAVLLDKVLFDLAVHTYKGAFGTCHSVSDAGMLKSAQLEATSGITRMLYGMGVYNPAITGVVSLAVSDYEFPSFFAEIARDARAEMLSKENHAGVTTVTYRTPDYMLSSVQDYRAGQKGGGEHVWQATLGPDSLVFANHPANSSETSGQRAGYWLGNGALPRTAQWKDVLVSVHNFREADGLSFTHAYFPVYQFDEYVLKDGWVMARKNSGYLAMTAARGLELVKSGQGGYHELRSYGSPNIWICQMGRAELDGSFEEFQKKVKAIRLEGPGNSAQFTSLRGDVIGFGWDGPLTVNGAEQALASEKAVDNPYCQTERNASSYEIGNGELLMRLNFD